MNSTHSLRIADPALPPLPPAPRTLEETGIGKSLVLELLAKTLLLYGELRLADLVQLIALPPSVLTPLLGFMRAEKLCEITRRGETDGRTSYTLTDLGRARADDFMRRCQYVGAAPVSLQSYVDRIRRQSVAHMGVTRERLRDAFEGIVAPPELLDQFGAAMNSNRPIFVYGPAGSGKTYIAERLAGLLSGVIAVPHALTVNGEVIQIFDPLVHEAVPHGAAGGALERGTNFDGRWVLCRRPVVMSGAELTLDMVDLEFDHHTRFYHAPQQLKASNGLFVIDDLGRQLVPAQDLMNRWIVPLDRRKDFLTLHTGQKFEVPFDVIVVFSSNLQPSDLADDAFLRRLGYKIFVGAVDLADYREIARKVCAELRMRYDEAGLEHLRSRYVREGRPLLACHPRDILSQVREFAMFNGMAPRMTPELLDWAWNNYFASAESAASQRKPGHLATPDMKTGDRT